MIWEVSIITSPLRRYLVLTPKEMKKFEFRKCRSHMNKDGYTTIGFNDLDAAELRPGMTLKLEEAAQLAGQKLKYNEVYEPRFEETRWRETNGWGDDK